MTVRNIITKNNYIGQLESQLKDLQRQRRKINGDIKRCKKEIAHEKALRANLVREELFGMEAE